MNLVLDLSSIILIIIVIMGLVLIAIWNGLKFHEVSFIIVGRVLLQPDVFSNMFCLSQLQLQRPRLTSQSQCWPFLKCSPNERYIQTLVITTQLGLWPVQSGLQPSQDYDILSHTIHVKFLYMSGETNSLKLFQDIRFLKNFLLQFYLLSEFLLEIRWEEVAEEIFFGYVQTLIISRT